MKPSASNTPSSPPQTASRQQLDPYAVKSLDRITKKKPRSTGKTIIGAVLGVVVVVVLIFAAFKLFDILAGQTVEPGIEVSVTIPEGASTSEIARILRDAGVISHEAEFKNKVIQQHADTALKPGVYPLVTGMSLDELVQTLVAGPLSTANRLTIPEGYTVEQTASAVEEACSIPKKDFLALAYSASTYLAEYPFLEGVYNNSLEGFLYPKTYEIPKGEDADYVIRAMLEQFKTETANLDMSYATSKNLTFYDVITIASLIEKETAASSERTLVSSVIYNRLRSRMRLQIDATVVYALGSSYDGHPLLYVDLEVDSPYNTYRVDQLPAGPICSPQISSIEAAVHPQETEYLYYVLTSRDGHHTFCVTSEEFEAAKKVYEAVFGI